MVQSLLDDTHMRMAKSTRSRRPPPTAKPPGPDPEAQVIAQNLRALRLARGLSQAELAQLTGTHLSHVGRAETGAYLPGSAFIKAVAIALQVTTDSLLFGTQHTGTDSLGMRIDRAMGELTGEERAALETLATALIERARDRAVRRKLEQEQQQ